MPILFSSTPYRFLVVLLGLPVVLGAPDFAHGAPEEYAAKVFSVSGKVQAGKSGQNLSSYRALQPGDSLFKGESITSGSNSSAKLLFTDRTIVDIAPSTTFAIDHYLKKNSSERQVDLRVQSGKVRTSVSEKVGPKGHFRVRTRSATMGVRGTEFLISSGSSHPGGQNAANDEITVVEGSISVEASHPHGNYGTAQNPIVLDAGTQVSFQANPDASGGTSSSTTSSEPKIVRLTEQELNEKRNEVQQSDNTFIQAIDLDRGNSEKESEQSGDREPAEGTRQQHSKVPLPSAQSAGSATFSEIVTEFNTQAENNDFVLPTQDSVYSNLPGFQSPDTIISAQDLTPQQAGSYTLRVKFVK